MFVLIVVQTLLTGGLSRILRLQLAVIVIIRNEDMNFNRVLNGIRDKTQPDYHE